jgi:hypothetical protein
VYLLDIFLTNSLLSFWNVLCSCLHISCVVLCILITCL